MPWLGTGLNLDCGLICRFGLALALGQGLGQGLGLGLCLGLCLGLELIPAAPDGSQALGGRQGQELRPNGSSPVP